MSVVHEVYQVSVHPSRDPATAAMHLAELIVQRWMPGHAGGALVLLVPPLRRHLAPLFERATALGRDVVLRVDTRAPQVQITEVAP